MRTVEQIQAYIANARVSLADYWVVYNQMEADGEPNTRFLERKTGIIKLYINTIQSFIDNKPEDVEQINKLFNALLSYLPSNFLGLSYTFYNPLASGIVGDVVIGAVLKATQSVYGIVRLSYPSVDINDPIVVSNSDPRITQWDAAYTLSNELYDERITAVSVNSAGNIVITKADATEFTSSQSVILNQFSAPQSASMWISGNARVDGNITAAGLANTGQQPLVIVADANGLLKKRTLEEFKADVVSGVRTVAGTANQVFVNGGTTAQDGNITLSLPQSIATTSDVQFNNGSFRNILQLTSTTNSDFYISGAAGYNRGMYYATGGVLRWAFTTNSEAESGSNAGSNFVLARYNDAGVKISDAFRVNRATNAAEFVGSLTANSIIKFGGLSTQFLKADGSVDSNTYLTGNQTITLSGEASGSGATAIAVTLSNSAVIGKLLTGYVSGAGVVSATDSILTAIQKLNGNIGALVTGVSSVFGRTGAVTAQSGDYTTAQVTESGNLYFTNARARASISETITGIDYDSNTGVFSLTSGYVIPTTTSAANWDTAYANRITSLTTTGSSGAATLISNVLNIPNYTLSGLGGVPYTGATTNVDLGEYGIKAGYFAYDTTPTSIPTAQGSTYWDVAEETIEIIMNGAKQHIGLDTFYNVKNSTGVTIPKGTAVRFAGTDGGSGHLLIAPFLANGTYPSTYYMGITAEDIASGDFGKVMQFGKLRNIDTSAFTNGDILYASTTVAGGFQTTAPVAPNNIVIVAAVVHASNNGTLVVRATLGSNINSDEGVKITSPATGQLLQLQASGLWENKSVATILGGTSSQFVKGDGSLDSNVYLTGNQTITLSGEASGSGATSISVTLANSAVIGKVLTGLSITGGAITSSDSILSAFGKVQNQINGLMGGVIYKGTYNASTNTPTLSDGTGTQGWYYVVNVAGTQNFGSGNISFNIGDWAIYNGSIWEKVDNTDSVTSVNGQIGAVVLTTSDITEGTNLYYTNARARASISETITGIDYDNGTGVFSLTSGYVIPTTTSASNWDTAYTNRITSLTTTGNSGSATLTSNTLNIPTYTLAGLGGQPLATNLTSLSGLTYASTSFVKMTAAGTFALDTNTYALASAISGTTGKLPKFTASGAIGDSIVSESGSVISVAGSFETNTTGYTIIAGNSSQNRTVKIGTGSTFEGSIQATLTNGTAWDLHINPEGGQIITANATDTGEHFIIGGSARVNGALTATGTLTVNEDGASTKIITIRSNWAGVDPAINVTTNNSLLLMTNNTERMRITSTGNVGIGTTSPTAKFHLVTTTGAYGAALAKFEDGWSVSSLKFTNPVGTFALQAYAQDNPSYYLPLVLNNQGGNVLIGTATDAGYKLDVNGTARVSGAATFFSGAGSPVIIRKNASFTGAHYILFQNVGESQIAYMGYGSGTNDNFQVANSLGETLLYGGTSLFTLGFNGAESSINTSFKISGTNNLTIQQGDIYFQASGRGLLSPDANRLVALENGLMTINGAMNATLGTNLTLGIKQLTLDNYSNEGVGITFNRTTSADDLMAIGVADSSLLGLFSRSGIIFTTGGTTNYSATTERMRITDGGNVGIGTTSPLNRLVASNSTTYNVENSYAIAAAGNDIAYKLVLGYDEVLDAGVIASVRTAVGWKDTWINPVGGALRVGGAAIFSGGISINSGDLQMNSNNLKFDQSGVRSWNIVASGGKLNFTSGDNLGVFDFGGSVRVNGGLQVNVATGYNALFQQSGTDLRINYLNQDLSANVSAAYRAVGYTWQDNGGSAIMSLSATELITFGATDTGEAHIFGGSARINGTLTINGQQNFINGSSFTSANTLVQKITTYAGSTNQFEIASINFITADFVDGGIITFNTNNYATNTERMRITSSGNVGIGTTSPSFSIHSYESSATGRITMTENGGTGTFAYAANAVSATGSTYGSMTAWGTGSVRAGTVWVQTVNAIPLVFGTDDTDRGRFTAGGNLLIGTATDSGYKLYVNGTFRSNALWTDSTSVSYWGAHPSAYGGLTWDTGYAQVFATTGNQLRLVAGTAYVVVHPDGNVGINTINPLSTLHVNGTVRTVLTSGVGGQSLLGAINGVSNGYVINVDTGNNITHTWHTGANNASMHINASGNVGIGTTSPNVSVFSKALTISSANSGIELTSATNVLQGSISANTNGLVIEGVGANGIRIFTSASGASSEVARITSSGNVLIGTTTDDGVNKLQVSGSVAVTGRQTISATSNSAWGLIVDNQGTTDAHGLYVNIGASSTGIPFRVDKNGSALFTIANTGAATFSSSVTAGGSVGVGGTNTDSLLTINGTAGTSHERFREGSTTVGFVGGANGIITGHNGKLALRAEAGLVLSGQGNAADFVINSSGNAYFASTLGTGSSGVANYAQMETTMASTNPTYGSDYAYFSMHRSGATVWQMGLLGNTFVLTQGGGASQFNLLANRPLTLTGDGNLTLLGGMTAGGLLTLNLANSGTNAYHTLNRNAITTENMFKWVTGGVNKWWLGQRSKNSEDGFSLYSGAVSDDVLYFNPAGNATFYGSVTAGASVTIGTGGTYAAGSIYSDANWGMIFRAKAASPANAMFLWTDSADNELMRIKEGKLGIGIASPKQTLDINGNMAVTHTNATTGYSEVIFYENSILQADIFVNGTSNANYAGASSMNIWQGQNAPIAFYTNGTNERMRITGGGNVGIGNNNPSYKLDVTGDVRASGKVYIGTNGAYIEEVLVGSTYELRVVDSAGNTTVIS